MVARYITAILLCASLARADVDIDLGLITDATLAGSGVEWTWNFGPSGPSYWTDTNAPIAMWEMNLTNTTQILDTSAYAGGLGGNYHASNAPSVAAGPARVIAGTNQFDRLEYGYYFDGSDDRFHVHNSFIPAISNDAVGTFNFWVNLPTDDNLEHAIFSLTYDGSTTTYLQMEFDMRNTFDSLRVIAKKNGIAQFDFHTSADSLDPFVGLDTMISVVQTTSNLVVYANASELGRNATTLWMRDITTNALPVSLATIGAFRYPTIINQWKGNIYEATYYNYTMTTNQLAELYLNTHPTNNIRYRP